MRFKLTQESLSGANGALFLTHVANLYRDRRNYTNAQPYHYIENTITDAQTMVDKMKGYSPSFILNKDNIKTVYLAIPGMDKPVTAWCICDDVPLGGTVHPHFVVDGGSDNGHFLDAYHPVMNRIVEVCTKRDEAVSTIAAWQRNGIVPDQPIIPTPQPSWDPSSFVSTGASAAHSGTTTQPAPRTVAPTEPAPIAPEPRLTQQTNNVGNTSQTNIPTHKETPKSSSFINVFFDVLEGLMEGDPMLNTENTSVKEKHVDDVTKEIPSAMTPEEKMRVAQKMMEEASIMMSKASELMSEAAIEMASSAF